MLTLLSSLTDNAVSCTGDNSLVFLKYGGLGERTSERLELGDYLRFLRPLDGGGDRAILLPHVLGRGVGNCLSIVSMALRISLPMTAQSILRAMASGENEQLYSLRVFLKSKIRAIPSRNEGYAYREPLTSSI
jgi:hypothetical protein